jgi:O-6-methylguanine DNA methyltransferase
MSDEAAILIERVPSPIGDVVLRHDGTALLALVFDDPQPAPPMADSVFARAVRAYFAGELDALEALPVRVQGTPFESAVWQMLRRIPVGQTWSYGALAAALDRPRAVRAVGRANGRNPVSLVLPCHRVIGADGRLVGYGGGLERKAWLLRHEGVLVA